MDFSQFKKVEVANKRKEGTTVVREQEFEGLKFRKALSKKAADGSTVSKFTVSKKLFNELNLTTFALDQFVHPTDKNIVLIGVVDDKDGKLLRKRKDKGKGDSFKSDALEASLASISALDGALLGKNQFLDAKVVGTNVEIAGTKVHTVLQLTKGAAKPKAEKPVVEATTSTTAPVAGDEAAKAPVADAGATPAAEKQPAASTDWD